MRDNELRRALDSVRADEALKRRTQEYVAAQTGNYGIARRVSRPTRGWRALAAASCLLIVLLLGCWIYLAPTAYISVDINPSLELYVNRFDQVVSAKGYNQAGQALADDLDIRFLNYSDAVEQILGSETVSALLSQDGALTIAVSGADEGQCGRMLSQIEIATAGCRAAHCYVADAGEAAQAREYGMSCGRYRAYLALRELFPEIAPEDVADMTMREIRDLLAGDQRAGATDPDAAQSGCTGGGCGHRHGNSW